MTRVIRLALPDDAAGCLDIYRPLVLETPVSFETTAPDVPAMAARIGETLATHPWLVCETAAGGVAGYAYASPFRTRVAYRWSTEVSVYVAPDHRRRGVARDLYARLLECARRLGYYNAYAGIALPNSASVAFHESVGFIPVGVYRAIGFKFDRWHDVGWWSLRLLYGDAAPEAPRTLSACRDEIASFLADAS